jgi:hypothetical protein
MMNEIKKLESSVSTKTCLDYLLSSTDSLGDIWQSHVSCGDCAFAKKCGQIRSAFLESDAGCVSCSKVIDILCGNKTVDEVLASL